MTAALARRWRPTVVLLLSLLAAGAAFTAIVRHASQRLLQRDAEHTALAWAHVVVASVEDLEPILSRHQLSDAARGDLQRLRNVQEVFRFKLFDRAGQTVLVSDDLDKPQALVQTQGDIGHGNDHVRSMVLGGNNVVELKDNANNPKRPARYSEAYVPLMKGGRVLGVVEVYVDQSERARRIAAAFGLVAGTVFALLGALAAGVGWMWLRRLRVERLAEERVRYLAHHDVLSGLLNRASFGEALHEAAWRHGGGGPGFAVLCIDLDRFKEVNDSQGHAAGDEVLRQVGERLRELVRHGDRVARLGGDEFALLQTGVSSPEAVTTLAERIVESLGQPYFSGTRTLRCGASVGAAIYGVDAQSEEELLHKADVALYRAKAAGRGTFSFYDAALDQELEARRALTHALREAIGSDQLSLHYQPLFGADGHTLTGYEALLRWNHPSLGAQSPAHFIPLAEETGLIDPLGRWVLQRACAVASHWPNGLSVAVNLSAAQFRSGDLVQVVTQALRASGLPAQRLELEITESLLMNNTEQVTLTLHQLAQMGVRIAMDDFGTGYSSLAYLWRFPFDKLKIDRAFTQNLESDPKVSLIVRSIITLAHSLQIRVNAEGVETMGQLGALRQHGCDELQGFLLGRPKPEAGLTHGNGAAPAAQGASAGTATLLPAGH